MSQVFRTRLLRLDPQMKFLFVIYKRILPKECSKDIIVQTVSAGVTLPYYRAAGVMGTGA